MEGRENPQDTNARLFLNSSAKLEKSGEGGDGVTSQSDGPGGRWAGPAGSKNFLSTLRTGGDQRQGANQGRNGGGQGRLGRGRAGGCFSLLENKKIETKISQP